MPWNELVKISLLGMENSTFSADVLQTLREQGFDVEKEASWLLADAVAFYAQLKKAGFKLEEFTDDLPPIAGVALEKTCSSRSAQHLQMILDGRFAELFPEFLEHLVKNGKCIPTEHLPALLSGPNAQALLKLLEPALGTAGYWLLNQHPEWKTWEIDPSQYDWHTGSKPERIALFKYLRQNDPEKAVELLQSTWQEESYRDKAIFLEELSAGLSMSDEPFLEAALDDGRKEVRRAVTKLLVKLPGSRFSERMFRRVSGCFDFRNNHLRITLPEEPDEMASRDGIVKIDPAWKGGAKASYLGQIVSAVPPKRWEAFFQKPPEEILELFFKTDWSGVFLMAITEATLTHNDEDWTDALLTWGMNDDSLPWWETESAQRLLATARVSTFNHLAMQHLEKNGGLPEANTPLFKLLKACTVPWDDHLTLSLVGRFRDGLAKDERVGWQHYHFKELLKMTALRTRPDLYDELQKGWNIYAPNWAFWEKQVEAMLNTLLFRKEMIAELQK